MALHPARQRGGGQAENQENDADDGDRLVVAKRFRADQLGGLQQLDDGDRRQQRRFLEERDQVIAQDRNDGRNRLRQDDAQEGAAFRQAKCGGRVALAAGNAGDAGAIGLRHVGRVVHGQREHADGERGQHDARGRQHEVQEIHLDQDGRAAHQFDEAGGRRAQRGAGGVATDRQRQAEQQRGDVRQQGGEDGVTGGRDQLRQDGRRELPVPYAGRVHRAAPRLRHCPTRWSVNEVARAIACAITKYIARTMPKIGKVFMVS